MKYRLLAVIMILSCTVVHAQSIDSLLVLQQQVDPQEKMYVHFDKNYYNPGETIWFKAYLFTGQVRSYVSKNFYAELRNAKGALISKKTAPVIFSAAASSFDLPDTFPASTVYFRAYTATMLNGDTDFIYQKAITIIHPNDKKTAAAKPVAQPTTIKFLPEGGDMIAGLPITVAFAATGAKEIPVAVSGVIKSADGKQVADFRSLHDGMGSFSFTPEAGVKYLATWKDENGKDYNTPLSAVKDAGIVMHLEDFTNAKKFTLTRQPTAAENFQSLTIISILNEQLVYQARINLGAKTTVSAMMPMNDLLSGILKVTVFDSNMKPLAERISFVNNANYEFDADAWISEPAMGKRAANRVEVKISDTIPANLSLSITDAKMDVPEPYSDNIVTHMLVTGELRGKVNEPYYYFFSTADSTAYYLDLVMLTHGWRRYNWDNVLSGKLPPRRFEETNYLGIAGKVVNATGSPFTQGLALNGFMMTQDSSSNLLMLPVERDGSVQSNGYVFYDSAKLYLQFSDKHRDFDPGMFNVTNGLISGNPTAGVASAIKEIAYEPDSATIAANSRNNVNELKVAAKKFKDAHELQNVTVVAKAKSPLQQLDEKYASGMFSGDGRGFDILNDPFATSNYSVFQYLQGKVAGLQITTGGANTTMSWRGGTPALYLDEVQSDPSMLQNISMSDIAYVKVFSPSSAGAIRSSGGGVIAVYTRKGGDAAPSAESNLKKITLPGYSAVKEFYSPDYSANSSEGFYENLSPTLYWNPFIVLDAENKKVRIPFFNNDITSSFRIVLEGINNEGKLIHVEKVVGGD